MKKEELITYQIQYLSRIFKRNIDQATAKFGLTAEQGRTMLYLHQHCKEVVHLTDLETSFNLRKSTLTSTINNLEKNGYVVRIVENDDQRQKRLELTQKGEEKVQLFFNVFHEENEKIDVALTLEEGQELRRLLKKVIATIDN